MFQLQNRYQDSGWESLGEDYCFESLGTAVFTAARCASDAICFGMVRVVDMSTKNPYASHLGCIIRTFPAGG